VKGFRPVGRSPQQIPASQGGAQSGRTGLPEENLFAKLGGLEPQAMHIALKQFLPYMGGNMYLLGETARTWFPWLHRLCCETPWRLADKRDPLVQLDGGICHPNPGHAQQGAWPLYSRSS